MHRDHALTRLAVLLTGGLLALLSACAGESQATPRSQPPLPTVELRLGNQTVQAELANTPDTRQIGLMGRQQLAPNHGMLFEFDHTETQCMWMKNTLMDLEVAFINESGVILNIERMKAGTEDIHCSRGGARYALEMGKGWFGEKRIKPGHSVNIPRLMK
ncbi:DUF192 domain-containing protein [Limnobacter humi]|uniref:DUF192 domain-containing protein n=2 Tax=Limnobacter humi TaxID=1778671 RepID=A0ABT1WG90_9BURK|nr:DUF192 domain-containing protein [Limnobacter humi]